jgi:hypothetical protein
LTVIPVAVITVRVSKLSLWYSGFCMRIHESEAIAKWNLSTSSDKGSAATLVVSSCKNWSTSTSGTKWTDVQVSFEQFCWERSWFQRNSYLLKLFRTILKNNAHYLGRNPLILLYSLSGFWPTRSVRSNLLLLKGSECYDNPTHLGLLLLFTHPYAMQCLTMVISAQLTNSSEETIEILVNSTLCWLGSLNSFHVFSHGNHCITVLACWTVMTAIQKSWHIDIVDKLSIYF